MRVGIILIGLVGLAFVLLGVTTLVTTIVDALQGLPL